MSATAVENQGKSTNHLGQKDIRVSLSVVIKLFCFLLKCLLNDTADTISDPYFYTVDWSRIPSYLLSPISVSGTFPVCLS